MTPEDFTAWRKSMRFSQRAAAHELGVSLPTLQAWERGRSFQTGKPVEIDRRTALACAALAAGLGADTVWAKTPRIDNGMRPVHPGEILLEDYLKPIGLTADALAAELDAPALVLVAQQKSPVTAALAAKLVDRFGGDAASWVRLQNAYDLRCEEIDSSGARVD